MAKKKPPSGRGRGRPRKATKDDNVNNAINVAPSTRASKRSKTAPTRFEENAVDDEEPEATMEVDTTTVQDQSQEEKAPETKTRRRPTPKSKRKVDDEDDDYEVIEVDEEMDDDDDDEEEEEEEDGGREENAAAAEKMVNTLLGSEEHKEDSSSNKKTKPRGKQSNAMEVDEASSNEKQNFSVVFKVPQDNGCVENVDIESNIPYESFRFRIADSMNISARKLNIGYKLSTSPAKDLPSVLSKVSHLVGLFEDVMKEKARLEKARKKGNNVKELFVTIRDLNEKKGTKSKGAKKDPKAKKAKPNGETGDGEGEEKSDDESGDSNETEPKKTSATWAVELDTALACDRKKGEKCEGGRCWKDVDIDTGEVVHHIINARDASFWIAALGLDKWKDLKVPPDCIANRIREAAALKKKPLESSNAANGDNPVQPSIQQSSAGSTTSGHSFPTYPYNMPAIHFHTSSLMNGMGGFMASPSKPMAPKRPPSGEITSSSLDAIPAKQFPNIRDFLRSVDQEEADGDDSPNYSQYAEKFVEKGYRRIHLLFDETPKSLQTDLELPISMGDAKQLLLHVKRACQKIAYASGA